MEALRGTRDFSKLEEEDGSPSSKLTLTRVSSVDSIRKVTRSRSHLQGKQPMEALDLKSARDLSFAR